MQPRTWMFPAPMHRYSACHTRKKKNGLRHVGVNVKVTCRSRPSVALWHSMNVTQAPAVRLTWVFAKKEIYKARIVMLGQHMQGGVHFNDTHAPVPSVTCVRIILALTASARRHLTQMDVKTAFLNAPMDIELDVLLPEGFGTGVDDQQYSSLTGRRRRALTAIPGCPQGSRVWRQKMVGVFAELGFSTFLPDEPCLFKNTHPDPIFLVLWVDDIIVSAPLGDAGQRDNLFRGLQKRFPTVSPLPMIQPRCSTSWVVLLSVLLLILFVFTNDRFLNSLFGKRALRTVGQALMKSQCRLQHASLRQTAQNGFKGTKSTVGIDQSSCP